MFLQNTFQKCRSSRSQMYFKTAVLNLHAWKPVTLLKERPQHMCLCEYHKIFQHSFYMEHLSSYF